jgi:dTDP-4-dehydrorhamnose reductase
MTILVIGSDGQVGSELVRRGPAADCAVVGLDRPVLDMTDGHAVQQAFARVRPALVINAAAYTAVDAAEAEPEEAFAVNRDGVANLAQCCAQQRIPLLHISTDYVFDGTQSSPYRETDVPHPLGIYGASKLAGEEVLSERLAEHILLRTAWVYSAHGKNFVKTMLRLGRERKALKVVTDQHGSPTAAGDIAQALLSIGRQVLSPGFEHWGTYHYAGAGHVSWYELAVAIFDLACEFGVGQVPTVHPITTAEYPTAARRPANSVLDCQRIREVFGIVPRPWRDSLAEVVKSLVIGELDY